MEGAKLEMEGGGFEKANGDCLAAGSTGVPNKFLFTKSPSAIFKGALLAVFTSGVTGVLSGTRTLLGSADGALRTVGVMYSRSILARVFDSVVFSSITDCPRENKTFLGEPIPLLTAGAGVEAALGKLANEGPRLVDSLTSADRGAMSEAESDADVVVL